MVAPKNPTKRELWKQRLSESHKGLHAGNKNPMFGKTHSEIIRAVLSKKPNGFSHWMNCEIQNRKVFI